MQQVITAKQAKQITGGRPPFLPIEYEEALKMLDACLTLDDAKYWDNYADAYEAWAKIHRSNDAIRKAKALKLEASRRMGLLAIKLRPGRAIGRKPGGKAGGRTPGPVSLLVESGMSKDNAQSATHLARLPADQFAALTAAKRPIAPSTARYMGYGSITPEWIAIRRTGFAFRSAMKAAQLPEVARKLRPAEIAIARTLMRELNDLVDEFERHLPKGKK